MYKRKLTRESLAELAKRMPVLSECQQMAYVGGYDDRDCWWRCIAYLKSCGTDYSSGAAMNIAKEYYGDKFDEDNYAFIGDRKAHQNFASNYFSGLDGNYCNGQILVFDPNAAPDGSGNNVSTGSSRHAVIFEGYDEFGNLLLFDPQTNERSVKSLSEIGTKAFMVNVR